ncbi:hypothetical protein OOZ19_27355 [Saccharopolyspora sp. NFXS83]|uniref:hypothetical protein n=1 Tax=Saccharopolyspora sp. NFXS83 TaxID=2993560 RepID=UPI00224B1231|nr:hypothetical protein [Saccharopolyspora sp. NFXS83]MCX2733977.1 hypothetical protein [Saccharopolyspora sp. NFXS83]
MKGGRLSGEYPFELFGPHLKSPMPECSDQGAFLVGESAVFCFALPVYSGDCFVQGEYRPVAAKVAGAEFLGVHHEFVAASGVNAFSCGEQDLPDQVVSFVEVVTYWIEWVSPVKVVDCGSF